MKVKRNQVKDVHECAVLENFKQYLLVQGKILTIISRRDPPDAIVKIDGKNSWVEITDAFFNRELAESITSNLANDKRHKPVPENKRNSIEPDQSFSDTLNGVITKKYVKDSMIEIFRRLGRGILLVGTHTPFSNAADLSEAKRESILSAISSKHDIFSEIYLFDGSGTEAKFFAIGLDE